jgi:hypothetical protein
MNRTSTQQQLVYDFWNEASCAEDLYLPASDVQEYRAQSEARYRLEPYIEALAGIDAVRSLSVLEIGVGPGADHQRFAEGVGQCSPVSTLPSVQ